MKRTLVPSTSLKSVGYDVEEGVLEIELQSGSLYQYLGVPAKVHKQLMSAESKGAFYTRYIKDHYRYRQVE